MATTLSAVAHAGSPGPHVCFRNALPGLLHPCSLHGHPGASYFYETMAHRQEVRATSRPARCIPIIMKVRGCAGSSPWSLCFTVFLIPLCSSQVQAMSSPYADGRRHPFRVGRHHYGRRRPHLRCCWAAWPRRLSLTLPRGCSSCSDSSESAGPSSQTFLPVRS